MQNHHWVRNEQKQPKKVKKMLLEGKEVKAKIKVLKKAGKRRSDEI